MMTTPDRRHVERARIPCRIPVELTDERHTAAFEADAVDLSVGGLSLRAERLPEVGKHLYCSFESMPGGAHVLGRGEVVWVQPSGDGGGEFGLRFIGIDAQTQALIDEMVAERVAQIDTPFSGLAPVSANLEIENVDAPIEATFVRAGDGEALFEQPLDLLALGRSVVAHAGVSLVRGSIARVDLRMDGGTPMLALTVRLKKESHEFGEFEWDDDASPDTEPDLLAPKLDAEEDSAEPPEPLAPDVAAMHEPLPPPAAAMPSRLRASDQMSLVFQHQASEEPESSEDSQRLMFDLDAEDDAEADARFGMLLHPEDRGEPVDSAYAAVIEGDWAHPPPEASDRSPLVQTLRVFAAIVAAVQRVVEPVSRTLRAFPRGAQDRIVTSTRRIVAQARPRRTTAGVLVGRRAVPRRGALRLLALAAMSIAAVALFAYALSPVGREDIALHRQIQTEPLSAAAAQTLEPNASVSAEADESVVPAVTKNELQGRPTQAASLRPTTAVATAAATSRAPAATVPAVVPGGAAYPTDARVATATKVPAAKTLVAGSAFGQKQVPNAKRFVLRMDSPVKTLQGTSDAHGFNVVIPGSLARDRAAPIAAGHSAVARATIINRGNRSEFSLQFADGRSPAYRVSAQGSALEVLIGQ